MAVNKSMLTALRACRATLRAQMRENWARSEWPETVFYGAFVKADEAIKAEEVKVKAARPEPFSPTALEKAMDYHPERLGKALRQRDRSRITS